jgi:hypothetical protein
VQSAGTVIATVDVTGTASLVGVLVDGILFTDVGGSVDVTNGAGVGVSVSTAIDMQEVTASAQHNMSFLNIYLHDKTVAE